MVCTQKQDNNTLKKRLKRTNLNRVILSETLVESKDLVKLRGNLKLRWAFPCPRARSGYILGATAFATLAAHLLERSLACASLRHTVVTIPNAICLYKTTTNIQICSRSLKTFQRNSDYLNIFRIWLKFCHR